MLEKLIEKRIVRCRSLRSLPNNRPALVYEALESQVVCARRSAFVADHAHALKMHAQHSSSV